ncbi:MAG: hypothetical protein N5P05_003059 [Chroococcopsis gigantea SAG 12.99]|jgi:hypothetical protein|nr:hypothetical protein [Chlorogloea purpurea SAG 13.99]MDV3001453.1 hypothetical protein [Chroococcopsis gigantea SAG 12.99]
MLTNIDLKQLLRFSKKILLTISCLLTLTFGNFLTSGSPAMAIDLTSNPALIADLGEYGRGDGTGNFKDKAEDLSKTIENLPDKAGIKAKEAAKTLKGDQANEIHGRARYDLGKAQNALEKDATGGKNIIKEIGDKISSQFDK